MLRCKRGEVLKEAVQRLQEARGRDRTCKDRAILRGEKTSPVPARLQQRVDEAVMLSRSAMRVLPPFISLSTSLYGACSPSLDPCLPTFE